uniref:Uncharacterized protein n=1 Tax=Anguilla anguilla TaxID=7936 RepID=A0A0E9SZ83_ANGAN
MFSKVGWIRVVLTISVSLVYQFQRTA